MTAAISLDLIDSKLHPRMKELRELLLEYERYLGVSLCFQSFEEEMAQLPGGYAPPDGRMYVALVDGEVAGCIALRRFDVQTAEMKRLYVRPAFHGKGLGRRLAAHIVQDARQIGYTRMLLDTLPKLNVAVALYTSIGFEEISAYNDYSPEGVKFFELKL